MSSSKGATMRLWLPSPAPIPPHTEHLPAGPSRNSIGTRLSAVWACPDRSPDLLQAVSTVPLPLRFFRSSAQL